MNARLIQENGVAKITINGETVSAVSFRSFWPQPEITRDFARGGIRLMSIYPSGILCSLDVPYSQFGEFWLGEGVYDWEVLRRQMDQFIENAPENYFSLILQLDTRDWYLAAHPQCQDSFNHIPEACSYQPWRAAAKRCIRDVLSWLDREYPEKIYAVYVCAGGTCEWYNRKALLEDPVKERAFQVFAGDPNRRLPSAQALASGEHGMLYGEADQNAVEYWRFLSEIVADTIMEFAHAVKEYNPGLLVGCFSGYILAHGTRIQESCQLLASRVFDCPDIDLIFSPASYALRGLESVSNSQLPMASVRLHGKLYYHEIDNTTYVANANPYAQVLQQSAHRRHASLWESIQYARREAACVFGALGTYWWFDMFGGWYDDPALQKELLAIGRAQERLYSRDIRSNAQVAMMVDEESNFYLRQPNVVHSVLVERQLEPLGRIGCAVDYFPARDLLRQDFPREQYRLYIFPNLCAPTPELREAVAGLRARGASMLFLFAPGILKDGKWEPPAMEELTGIRLRVSDAKMGYTLVPSGPVNDDSMGRVFGGEMGEAGPVIEADETDAYVFGRGLVSGKSQLVVKPRPHGGFDAWAAQGTVPEYILRPLARMAGAWIYQADGLPVYTNSRMLALFDHKGGERDIRVPWQTGVLEEMYTGERHALQGGDPVRLHFEANECKCFLYLREGGE